MNVVDVSKLAWNADKALTVAEATGGRPAVVEPKYDGIRLLVHVTEDGVEMYARSGNSKRGHLLHVEQQIAAHFPPGTWLDGEAVAFKINDRGAVVHEWGGAQSVLGGNPKAEAAQRAVSFVVFDLISFGGTDARPLPYSGRRELLESAMEGFDGDAVFLSPAVPATEEAHEANLAAGYEGSMVKLIDARYASGRRGHGQVKLKPQDTDDAVIVGYKDGNGAFEGLVGALALGMVVDGELVEVTTCSGMTYELRCEISANRDKYLGRVIEFAHHGVMPSGGYRHPQFKRFRDDKAVEQCDAPAAPAKKEARKVTEPKQDSTPAFDPATAGQTGRSGTGRLRNFKSMNDAKLAATLEAVMAEQNDPEAIRAIVAETERRGAQA